MNRMVEKSSSNPSRIKIAESGPTTTGNNIILLRGAQSDGGHIILQNGQELLQLLNGEGKSGTVAATATSGKTIILQSPRVKQAAATEASKNVKNRIMLHQQQSAPSTLTVDQSIDRAEASDGETILVQTTNGLSGKRISATTLSDGSILLHPRIVDSFATTSAATGNTTTSVSPANGEGPILLQTLKRFDKSIFVLRNSTQTSSSSASTKVVGNLQSKIEDVNGNGTVSFDNECVSKLKASSVGGRSAGRGGAAAAATTAGVAANVFSKANNVIANGGSVSVRSNGISTRSSSTGQQKQPRGANRSDSESSKKESTASKQSNIHLGNGE